MYFIFSLSISDFSNKAIPRTYQSPLVYKTVSPKSQVKWDQMFHNVELNWKLLYNIPKI